MAPTELKEAAAVPCMAQPSPCDCGVEKDLAAECNRLRLELEVANQKLADCQLKLNESTRELKKWREEHEWKWQYCRLSSPLTKSEQWASQPFEEAWAWKWFKAACPCCKRPVEVSVIRASPEELAAGALPNISCAGPNRDACGGTGSSVEPQQDCCGDAVASNAEPKQEDCGGDAVPSGVGAAGATNQPQHAYIATLWGSDPGFVAGALVLGRRIRELGSLADLVLLHTDDVPFHQLDLLGSLWKLRTVEYIEAVPSLFSMRGTRFDGVFTKIHAWGVTQYSKALLLDLDLVPLQSLDPLFELQPPAAMARGHSDLWHGVLVDGTGWFIGEEDPQWAWRQAGGINAGVILLQPSQADYEQMKREVTTEGHPEHVAGNGPEQDYLSRYFANAPWRHICTLYNFQPHHVPFALERVLAYRSEVAAARAADPCVNLDGVNLGWLPLRLTADAEDVKNVHFSGEAKLWDRFVPQPTGEDDQNFADRYLRANLAGWQMWVERTAPAEHYAEYGCRLLDDGSIQFLADGSDVTELVDLTCRRVREVTRLAAAVWRETFEDILRDVPNLLQRLTAQTLPTGCHFRKGDRVDAYWGKQYYPAEVKGVHCDGNYIVDFTLPSGATVTERSVEQERLRKPQLSVSLGELDLQGSAAADAL